MAIEPGCARWTQYDQGERHGSHRHGELPLRWPLPEGKLGDLLLIRGLSLFLPSQVRAVHGLEYIEGARDPFILVANHSTRREALLVPALVALNRGGRYVHFLADWNFKLIPGIGWIFRRGQVITVAHKSARPRVLNLLKPLYTDPTPPFERARRHLEAGRSVGVFPEATVNRNPDRLLTGRAGAARLSLESAVPIVPMGIRFPERDGTNPGPMEVYIGSPLAPPVVSPPVSVSEIRRWHGTIMTNIARLSGKDWMPHRRSVQTAAEQPTTE